MIEVKLQFPSISAMLAAFNALPAGSAITHAVPTLSADQQAAVDDTAGLEAKVPTKKSQPATTARTEPIAKEAKADAPVEKAKPSVSYTDVQPLVFELAGLVKARGLDTDEHVKSIARGLGSASGSMAEFKDNAAKLAEALPLIQAKIAEVKAMEAEVA